MRWVVMASFLCLAISASADSFQISPSGLGSSGAEQINAAQPIGQVFVAQDQFVQSIGFSIEDMNPYLDPLNLDTVLTFTLYEGEGASGSPIAIQRATILPPYSNPSGTTQHQFLDADFSGIPFVVGATYTVTLSDPTPRWGVSIFDFPGNSFIPGFEVMLSGVFASNWALQFRVIDAAGNSPVELSPLIPGVPEPTSIILLGTAIIGVGSAIRRKLSLLHGAYELHSSRPSPRRK